MKEVDMLYIIGIGPGKKEWMSQEAIAGIEDAQVIVGYKTYIDLIQDMIGDKEIVANGMRKEIERCQEAIDIVREGKKVALISSGDAGVYGMAGLIYELLEKSEMIPLKVIPGITASLGASAIMGAPLMNDFCHISLSDLMTPMEMIERRLRGAAMGDFVICLYNARSKGRPNHLGWAMNILLEYKSENTIVAIGKDVGRKEERVIYTTLKEIPQEEVDMTSIVIVGNETTRLIHGKMVTPRGYYI